MLATRFRARSRLTGGALYQGDDPNNPDWDRPWTIGRGEFGGGPADFFDGIIDEVRLSNTALSPSQFLFAPPVAAVPGDYNNNGKVDAADYVQWRNGGPLQNEVATVGTVTPEDYTEWRSRFGNPPGSAQCARWRRRRTRAVDDYSWNPGNRRVPDETHPHMLKLKLRNEKEAQYSVF